MTEVGGETVLEVSGLYKKFSRSQEGQRRLLADQLSALFMGRAPEHRRIQKGDFWSLQDISFNVRRGEVLGVIGFNGAGKSTLLRVLAGLMMPDIGEVRVYGETGTLIELGAGMQTSLSGTQNIFIKGALLGKSKEEMIELYPRIAEFSELGDFLAAPIKTYSSGMRLRLGFSVAVHMRPDLLLLDEILAVGDYAFKQKCRGYINDLLTNAGVVFVSHSMDDVRQICDSVVVLDRGKVLFHGAPKKAINLYYDLASKGSGGLANPDGPHQSFYGELFDNKERITDVDHHWANSDGEPQYGFNTWDSGWHRVRFKLIRKPRRLVVGLTVWTQDGMKVTGMASDMSKHEIFDHNSLEHDIMLYLPKFSLNAGSYVSTLTIVDNGEALYRGLNKSIKVESRTQGIGVVTPAHEWMNFQNSDLVSASAAEKKAVSDA